jgi:hypothetical protein
LSIIHKQATSIDWDHLFDRVADDAGLLGGLMGVFAWLCPQRASTVPEQVWARLGLTVSPSGPDCAATNGRARLLDSRPWFVPLQLADQTDPDHR